MRPSTRLERLILPVLLLLAACGRAPEPEGGAKPLQLIGARFYEQGTRQWLEISLQHPFNPTLIEALQNGVVLPYAWELELMDADGSPWQTRRWLDTGAVHVSYRSFTRWYNISQSPSGLSTDYPDLARTGEALEGLKLAVHIPPELMRSERPYRFRFRFYLDINRLPPPMRLPAQMQAVWRLDSGWFEWWPPAGANVDYHVSR